MASKESTGRPPADGRIRAPKPDRRRALIDAAIELFSETGAVDISAGAIARKAGVAHGLLFYYFTDLRGLLGASLLDVMSRLGEFQAPTAEETTARQKLEGLVSRHIEFLRRYHVPYMNLLREGVLSDPEFGEHFDRARSAGVGQVVEIIGLQQQTLPPLARTAIQGWTGFLDSATDELLRDPDADQRAMTVVIVDVLFAALAASGVTLSS